MNLEEYKEEIKNYLVKEFHRTETQTINIINHNNKDIEMFFIDKLSTKEVATILNFAIYEVDFKK